MKQSWPLVWILALLVSPALLFSQPSVAITEYPTGVNPSGITTGPDGALWFTEASGANKIGRITTAGAVTEYPVRGVPLGITMGPDGALWFAESNGVGRITTAGSITEYPVGGAPQWITTGPDGALWFTEYIGKIGRISTAGAITEYPIPAPNTVPLGITPGPDGALWFIESNAGKIGRITPTGIINEYSIPGSSRMLGGIATGPDGALWFTDFYSNMIARITTAGAITEYQVPTANSIPGWIANGPDGALWFTETNSGKIGRITTVGAISEYPIPTASSGASGITAGPDGALWFTESNSNKIGRVGVSVSAGPTVSYASLPPGEPGFAYATGLGAGGGTPPYSNWIVSSGTLPPGLVLSPSTGVISGAPTSAGTGAYNFSVTVQDSKGATSAAQTFSINVAPALQIVSPTSLSAGTAGVAYPLGGGSLAFSFTGGWPPGTWSAAGLPSGITMTAAGNLSGVPSAGNQGTYHPQFAVRDSINATATINLTLIINAAAIPLQITTNTLPSGTTGTFYSQLLAASGGSPPYNWSVISGGLPLGLSLSNAGTITGTPTSAVTQTFTVRVTDASAASTTQTLAIAISLAPCSYSLSSNTQSFTAVGGSGSINVTAGAGCTWSVSGVPPWVSITNGASGTGNGSVSYVVAPNTSVNPLNATLIVAGFSFTIQEAASAPTCAYALSSSGQAFTSAGGSGSATVTTGTSCSWTVTGAPSWVTVVNGANGTGNGVVNYTVAANNLSSALTATLTIAGSAFTIQEQAFTGSSFIGSMPHMAAEGGWNTTFTLVNKGSTAAQAQVSLFDNNGNPVALPLTLPQQASSGTVTEASTNQALAANASLIVTASGPANVPYLEGSAQLMGSGNMDGFAIFHFDPSGQEAVVPLETRNAVSYFVPFDNTNGVLTGIAVENISGSAQSVRVSTPGLFAGSITLPANGHTSFVLSEWFPITANIRGMLEFDTTQGQISVLGIRHTPPGTLTTIPALVNMSTGGGSFAHIASGNGWQTTFVLVNTDRSVPPAQAQLKFFDNNGSPLSLPLTYLETGTTSTASSVTQTISVGDPLWIQTSGSLTSSLLTGSAQLVTSGNISGYAIFRYNPNSQEAVVPLETRNAGSYLIAFDNTNGTATGVALNAIATQAVNVSVVIRDDAGNQRGAGTIPLSANGHTSFVLATQFPGTSGIRGTVEFDTPPGAQISVLGIRSPPALTFTTLPPLAK